MTLNEIKQKIKEGLLFEHEGRVYTPAEWKNIQYAEKQEEHYDLLQLTKKIQL